MLGPRPDLDRAIEDLMHELKNEYTIVIVTHNMQQAARASDQTACLMSMRTPGRHRTGILAEYDPTDRDLHEPSDASYRGLRHGTVRLMRRRNFNQVSTGWSALCRRWSDMLRALSLCTMPWLRCNLYDGASADDLSSHSTTKWTGHFIAIERGVEGS